MIIFLSKYYNLTSLLTENKCGILKCKKFLYQIFSDKSLNDFLNPQMIRFIFKFLKIYIFLR